MDNTRPLIFTVQPEWCRKMLPEKPDLDAPPIIKRVLSFNPAPVYFRHPDKFLPYERIQNLNLELVMKQHDTKLCACGCKTELTGRRRKWAGKECSDYAWWIYVIFSGYTDYIGAVLRTYYGNFCKSCNGEEKWDNDIRLQVDHIHPVKLGGGGGWLSNYQLLCGKCHREKTNADFGWNEKERKQVKLNL